MFTNIVDREESLIVTVTLVNEERVIMLLWWFEVAVSRGPNVSAGRKGREGRRRIALFSRDKAE